MGNSIATAIAEKQKETQRELQKEMQEAQLQNMIRGQERMRRLMVAQQMAFTREMFWWQAGFGAFVGTIVVAGAFKGKVPRVAFLPLLAYGTVVAYQWDFAYGNKAERVNQHFNDIVKRGDYWFTPILPPKN